MAEEAFRVLTDPWIPLEQTDGSVQLGSFRNLLIGALDGVDIAHPRADMKVYVRVLLAALLQRLFPAQSVAELASRARKPMNKSEVDKALETEAPNFNLLGAGPRFLQGPAQPGDTGGNETERLFPDLHSLFKGGHRLDMLCPPCATVALYGIQAFAPAGGRGYTQCIRGSSSVTTLVVSGTSVRADAWNATLAKDFIQEHLPGTWADGESPLPWTVEPKDKAASDITLSDVLFWMPRRLWLEQVDNQERFCPLCGRKQRGLLKVTHFSPGPRVTDGFLRHPHCPVRLNAKTKLWLNQRLTEGQPAWTGLADMLLYNLDPANGRQPAPVVAQWQSRHQGKPVALLCFATLYDQTKLLQRFSEQFTLAMDRWSGREPEALLLIQGLVQQAAEVLKVLLRSLARGRPTDPKFKLASFWQDEASAAYWRETEEIFWSTLHELESDLDVSAQVTEVWQQALRSVALRLFREHTAAVSLDASQMQPMARAQRRLYRDLRQLLPTTSTTSAKVST